VMGDSGPIQLDVNNTTPLTVAPTGEVSQGPGTKGRLKLCEFDNPGDLTGTATGLFLPADSASPPVNSTSSRIQQGFLEGGNTSSMSEMGNLISAMRFYEANQKVIQNEDDRVSHLIS